MVQEVWRHCHPGLIFHWTPCGRCWGARVGHMRAVSVCNHDPWVLWGAGERTAGHRLSLSRVSATTAMLVLPRSTAAGAIFLKTTNGQEFLQLSSIFAFSSHLSRVKGGCGFGVAVSVSAEKAGDAGISGGWAELQDYSAIFKCGHLPYFFFFIGYVW